MTNAALKNDLTHLSHLLFIFVVYTWGPHYACVFWEERMLMERVQHHWEQHRWPVGGDATLEPPQTETEESRNKPEHVPPHRVLVVDDSKDARNSMATLLREFGYVVQTACDGETALARAVEFQPHVMIIDIVMPGMSGFRVAEKVRADPTLWDTVLITLTGWDDDMDPWLSHHAGCDYHLKKPLDLAKLESVLEQGRSAIKYGEA
jgi:CheY-like chemotaxis protein